MIQTTSLELSKKLKEAGFPQEGTFYWQEWNEKRDWELAYLTPDVREFQKSFEGKAKGGLIPKQIIAALTSEEILEQLPHGLLIYKYRTVYLEEDITFGFQVCVEDKSIRNVCLAEALGEMGLYLKEQGLLA